VVPAALRFAVKDHDTQQCHRQANAATRGCLNDYMCSLHALSVALRLPYLQRTACCSEDGFAVTRNWTTRARPSAIRSAAGSTPLFGEPVVGAAAGAPLNQAASAPYARDSFTYTGPPTPPTALSNAWSPLGMSNTYAMKQLRGPKHENWPVCDPRAARCPAW
jgi:hypothetical protein